MKKKDYTLKDIAELAQVSRGTVDRVIHGRGKVSKDVYTKVKNILDKVDYRPNLVAQTLKKGELFRIAVLMPDYRIENYWKRAVEGVDKAIEDYASIGVKIELYLFNPYESKSYREKYEEILSKGFTAVLFAPYFYKESLDFMTKCKAAKLHYFTFNTFIEDSGALSHIGQDLIQSGKIAASLMRKVLGPRLQYLVMHINEEIENSRHMQDKERGFIQYMNEHGADPNQIHVLTIDNKKETEAKLISYLTEVDDLKGIYVTTSKVWLVAEILQKHSMEHILIGYDLLDENVKYLETGNIDFLIFQNPKQQTHIGISTIIDHVVFRKEVRKVTMLPIEIIIKENIDHFID